MKNMLLKSGLTLVLLSVLTTVAPAQDFVSTLRATLDNYGEQPAESLLKQYRAARGITPEYLDAYSWLARKALDDREYASADQLAKQTYQMCVAELKGRSLDAEPHLPIALGAAIEVRGQVLAAEGHRAAAKAYLLTEQRKYANTSIADRIQKNVNLISLQGTLAPPLQEVEYLGPKPKPLAAYRGKPLILFFWAHWCVDCKAEAPILAQLKSEYQGRLAIVAPTQRYGYAAAGNPASPAAELRYIDGVRATYYSRLSDVPVPVSQANFRRYGASTTPTIVIVGADGRVSLYHPGRMTYEELKQALAKVGLS